MELTDGQKLTLKKDYKNFAEIIAMYPRGQNNYSVNHYTVLIGGHKLTLSQDIINEIFEELPKQDPEKEFIESVVEEAVEEVLKEVKKESKEKKEVKKNGKSKN